MAKATKRTTRRWGLLYTFAVAFRTAVRPGSAGIGDRLRALPRLARATASGRYHGTSLGRLGLVVAAFAYVVSPVDLFPEALFSVLGFADDAMVASWIAATLVNETEAFLAWERGGSPRREEWPDAGGAAGDTDPRGRTVPGHVVG